MATSPVALASVSLLCAAMATAVGGGLYEHAVLMPLWASAPPSSFAIVQPGTGVPLQRFWMPVHAAITLLLLSSLVLTWRDRKVRSLILLGAASYLVMRAWSGLYFIPEMLAFQRVALEGPATAELSARVARWTFWTWFREPLDVVSFFSWLFSLRRLHS